MWLLLRSTVSSSKVLCSIVLSSKVPRHPQKYHAILKSTISSSKVLIWEYIDVISHLVVSPPSFESSDDGNNSNPSESDSAIEVPSASRVHSESDPSLRETLAA